MSNSEFAKLDLVESNQFTPAEKLLSRVVVSTARGGGTMYRGRLAECVVAIALRADHADLGTAAADLRLPDGRTIEVKSSASSGKFSIGDSSRSVDIWIFVHVGESEGDWRFTLALNDAVNGERKRFKSPRKSPVMLSRTKVSEWGVLTELELIAAVRKSAPRA